MQNNELIKQMEKLNLENIKLKNSKEYKLGEDFENFKMLIKKRKVGTIITKLINRKKIKKYNAHDELENDFIEIDKKEEVRPKIAIYTCITGEYDKLLEPFLTFDNIDYYAFLDDEKVKSQIWNIKKIPEMAENNILKNRYVKFHPHEFFEKEYDYTIYIDGNIQTITDMTSLVYAVNEKTGLALHVHQFRDCIYDEIEVCKILKKGNYKKLKEQVNRYKNDKFPKHFGMLECNVIVTDMHNENSKKILENWWEEFKNSESLRDQISFPYILWKKGYEMSDIGFLGNNVYRNPKLRLYKHKNN